jgi:hypothetical protein
LEVEGRSGSFWWREVARIRDGVGAAGEGWFAERVTQKVGNGADTLFWYDRWLGGSPLCERFSRLFDLAEDKAISVATLLSLGWEEGGEA